MLVRDADLYVQDTGAGHPLLWAHGMMSSVADEDALAPARWLTLPEGVRLIRYDARGHGRSAAAADPRAYEWDALGRDMLALADASGAARVLAGGWSMGCAAALHAAVLAPARFAGLILLQPPRAWEARVRLAQVYARALRLDHVHAAAHSALRQRAFAAAAASDLPARALLRRLTLPVLIIGVAGEAEHPLDAARQLHALLPGATLTLAECGPADPAIAAHIANFVAAVLPTMLF